MDGSLSDSRREERQEETKGQTHPEKAAALETVKALAHGCPSCLGTLGRFERKEGADEGACT